MIDSLDLVRSLYTGFARGDVDAALERSAVDVTIDQDPRLPWGGHYVGRAGVVEFLTKLATIVDTTIMVEHLFRAGDDVVEFGRSIGTVRGTGAAIDVPECHIWTIRDDTIVAARFYIDTDTVLAALRTEAATDPT